MLFFLAVSDARLVINAAGL